MNILFVTITWPHIGDRNLYYDLMHEFKNNGHHVHVAFADEKVEDTQVSTEEGLEVLRMSTSQIRKAGKLKKAISLPLLGVKFKNNINKYFNDVKFDLIIGHTPPITLSGLMKYLKKKHHAFCYLLLKDIWPHSSVDLKIIKKKGLAYLYFRWHEKRFYRTADIIGCMSPKNVEYILKNNRYLNPDKVEVCPNTITPKTIEANKSLEIRSKYNIPINTTVFIFSGNLSKGHGLEYYVEVIRELNDYKSAYFLIGGSGTYYNYLNNALNNKKLNNVFLYEWLPREDFNKILSTSDVGVILLSSEYTVPQFPSRLLAYLEASKPILCAVNQGTDIGTIVEQAGCGISTIHGDKQSFIGAIKNLSENAENRQKLAGKSRTLLENQFTSSRAYRIIMRHLE